MVGGICFEVFFWQMLHIREHSLQKNIYDGVYFKKVNTLIAQNAIQLFTDFTTDSFWRRFQKLAVLKSIFRQKIYDVSGF